MPLSSSSSGSSGGRSSGNNGGRGAGSSGQQQVIIAGGGGGAFGKPKTLLNAISEIQQFYVIESRGKNIPKEFLTLEQTIDFMNIGASNAFVEGLILALVAPIIELYVIPFMLNTPDLFTKILFLLVPYLAVIMHSILCVFVSKYYIGEITRKAINTLFLGRSMVLIVKAGLIYFIWSVISQMMTRPTHVWSVAKIFGKHAEGVYRNIIFIQPRMMGIVSHSCIALIIAATLPYLTAFFFDKRKQERIRKNIEAVSGDTPT